MDKETALKIIDYLYQGKTLTQAFKDFGVSPQTFYTFRNENPFIAECLARAQDDYADLLVDSAIELSDNQPDVNRARIQVDIRKWAASKYKPHRYGDRIDMNVNGTLDFKAALEQREQALLLRRYPENVEDAQLVEPKQLTEQKPTDTESVAPETRDAEEMASEKECPSKLEVDPFS
jgi:hypothetical protein